MTLQPSLWVGWIGKEDEPEEVWVRPAAELYDERVAPHAHRRAQSYGAAARNCIAQGLPVMAGSYARAAAHWANVHSRFQTAACLDSRIQTTQQEALGATQRQADEPVLVVEPYDVS